MRSGAPAKRCSAASRCRTCSDPGYAVAVTSRHSILIAGCCLLAAGCGSPAERDPFVVASDFSNPPFAAWEGDEPEGFEPELARALASDLGRPVEWSKRSFDTLLDGVVDGSADIVIATHGITPERAERVAFTRPYYRTAICAVVRTGAGEPDAPAELAGRPVGASPGTTSERALRTALADAVAVLEREQEASWETMLLDGSIDAAIMDCPDVRELGGYREGSLRRLAEPLAEELYAGAVALDREELLASVNGTIARLESDGTLARWAEALGL